MPPRISVFERGLDSSRFSLLAPDFYTQNRPIPRRILAAIDHVEVEQLGVTIYNSKFERTKGKERRVNLIGICDKFPREALQIALCLRRTRPNHGGDNFEQSRSRRHESVCGASLHADARAAGE